MLSGMVGAYVFLTLVLRFRKNPGKKLQSGKLTRPGREPGRARWEVRVDHNGGQDLLILVALCGDFTVYFIIFAARFPDLCSNICAAWISYCSECADTRAWIFFFLFLPLKQFPRSTNHRGGWGRCTSYIFIISNYIQFLKNYLMLQPTRILWKEFSFNSVNLLPPSRPIEITCKILQFLSYALCYLFRAIFYP